MFKLPTLAVELSVEALLVFVVMLALAGYGAWQLANEWVPKLMHLVEQLENKP